MNLIKRLEERELIKKDRAPSWLSTNTIYLTTMGSVAYGVANYESGDLSDFDVYGVCVPQKGVVFPHLEGEILGFGRQVKRFEQWQVHHVFDPDALAGKGRMYDFSVYNIVKYFTLLMENNPNIIDSIFTPQDCVLHITQVGNMIRENRNLFLHKGCWHKFKGYAYSQVHKMSSKSPEGKRVEIRDRFGYDVKFAYHVVRLLNEVEQILTEGTLDLRRNNEQLKSIRRGEWKEEDIVRYFNDKERQLEELYHNSKLPWGPDEPAIKQLLLNCLEQHYGSLTDADIVQPEKHLQGLRDIRKILDNLNIRGQ